MAEEELKSILRSTDEVRLSKAIKTLEYFREKAEFVYPLDERDNWFFKGEKQEIEATKVEMEALNRAELLVKDRVSCRIPFRGDIMVYELNEKGNGIFEKLFNQEPKMCSARHYATTH